TSANVNRAQLQTLPVGIIEYHVGQDDSVVILRNNQQQNIVVTQIFYGSQTCAVNRQITPGRQIRVDCDNVNSSLPLSDVVVEYRVQEATYYVSTSGSTAAPSSPVASFSGWCYQETANASHPSDGSCDLLYTGNYVCEGYWDILCENIFDGNWETFGRSSSISPPLEVDIIGDLYINYTIPQHANLSSQWQIKTGNDGIQNLTLVSCAFTDTLQLHITSENNFKSTFNCWDGSSWDLIYEDTHMDSGDEVYEEAMWWYIDGS
ncbi:MAG: hypothetical protein ACMXYC_04935, partial [Candidatus Woesearchaeota archaeon]